MAYIVCTSNLDLVSFLCASPIFYFEIYRTFPFTCLLTFCAQQRDSKGYCRFVHMTVQGNYVLFNCSLLWYIYEEHCLTTSCDTAVSCYPSAK